MLERETVGSGTTSKAAGGIRGQFPHGDRDPLLAREPPGAPALRGGVRRRPRLEADRLPLPHLERRGPPGLRDAHRAPAPPGRRRPRDHAQGSAGHRPGAPRRRPRRRRVGAPGRRRGTRRGDGRLRPARARARRAHRRGRGDDGAPARVAAASGACGPPTATIAAPVVVNAAGPAAARVGRLAGLDPPGAPAPPPHLLHGAVPGSPGARADHDRHRERILLPQGDGSSCS